MNEVKIINLDVFTDEEGSLVPLEELSPKVPFDIKRVYYIFNVNKDVVRGKHAHYKLKQLLVCVTGSVDILVDDGKRKEVITLDSPSKGLYIGGFIWREMANFSRDAVVLVVADDHYNIDDNEEDYEQFLKDIDNQNNKK